MKINGSILLAFLAALSPVWGWGANAQTANAAASQDPPLSNSPSGTIAQPESTDYYCGYRKQIVGIELALDKIAVTFTDTATFEDAQGVLKKYEFLNVFDSAFFDEKTGFKGAKPIVAYLGKKHSVEYIRSLIRNLNDEPGVLSANPVHIHEGGREAALSDMFYVTVPLRVSDCDMRSLFCRERLEVLYGQEYSTIGERGYRVVVTKSSRELGAKDALEEANRFNDLPFVIQATPDFTPLFQVAATDPVDELFTTGPSGLNLQYGQWNMRLMSMPAAWNAVYGNPTAPALLSEFPRIVIASLDTGVALDFRNRQIDGHWTHLQQGSAWGGEVQYAPENAGPRIKDSIEGHSDFLVKSPVLGDPPLATNQWINQAELLNIRNGLGDDDDQNEYVDDVFGWDFVGNDPLSFTGGDHIPYPDYCGYFENPDGTPNQDRPYLFELGRGHGTLIGVAAARGNNTIISGQISEGIAGACWTAQVMPVRYRMGTFANDVQNMHMFDVYSSGRMEQAILYACRSGAHVVYVPICETYDLGVHEAVREGRARGVLIVAPAGNEGKSLDANPSYPAVLPEVIAAGMSSVALNESNSTERRAEFINDGEYSTVDGVQKVGDHLEGSNYGWSLDVLAPVKHEHPGSKDITEYVDVPNIAFFDDPDKHYRTTGGTSTAGPTVAGLAALVLTVDPSFSPAEVQAFLQWGAYDLVYTENFSEQGPHTGQWFSYSETAAPGRDYYTGWGRVDGFGAVSLAKKKRFRVRDSRGKSIMSWDEDGRFIIDGDIKESASSAELEPTDSKEFIVRRADGTVLARLDSYRGNAGSGYVWPRFYLKGTISIETSPQPSATNREFIIKKADGTVAAFIDPNGNMHLKGSTTSPNGIRDRVFAGAKPDREGVYTVNAPAGAEGIVNFPFNGGLGIRDAITAVPNHSVVKVYPGYYCSIDLGSKNLAITSSDPNDRAVVESTIISGWKMGPAVRMSAAQGPASAIIGFTITAGWGVPSGGGICGGTSISNGSTARIMYNIFKANGATFGGAVAYCHGLIEGNEFGTQQYAEEYVNGAIQHGGAIYGCSNIAGRQFSIIRKNVFFNNSAGGEGGAIAACNGTIEQNFIAYNDAVNGGGIASAYTVDETGGGASGAIIRYNIFYANQASGYGGAMFQCDYGSIENNTIYGNTAPTSGCGGIYDCNPRHPIINCIVWANSNDEIVLSGTPDYCMIDVPTNPNWGQNCIGAWQNITPEFTSVSPQAGWDEFLHISDDSPCRDSGIKPYNISWKDYIRDFDDAIGPHLAEDQAPDIGADEAPTATPGTFGNPEGAIYWWERF
ncbi:MAG: S8 family serine peptidase [Candidatus Hydrogenedentes bacterium]|nr:S8 family serine peptidase [Candidatus Hydrogenedentota bacterium]